MEQMQRNMKRIRGLMKKIRSHGRRGGARRAAQAAFAGDRPDRRLSQYVRVDGLSSKFPEWDGAEQVVYGHSDTVGGSGISTGYSMTTLKTGEKVWSKWESVQYLVSKGGEGREVPFQGVFRFIAGTGKYKALDAKALAGFARG
jgi:hypothetical protein